MTHPLVVTRPIGGTPLAHAAVAGTAPDGWYPGVPRSTADWRDRVEATRADGTTAGWADRLAPALASSGAAAERLRRAARGHGVVVTTGQQPGLFGGPVYTWSKAVSALALADALEQACGVPVVPVFWAATDDADFEEARSTLVAVPGGVETLRLPDPAVPGFPMAETPLGDTSALLAQLSSGAGSAASAGVLSAVAAAYGDPSATVGSAYVRLLRHLLEPLGICVLDASHPAVRIAMHPVMVQALQRHDEIARENEVRAAAIRDGGFTPQVELVPELTLVSRTTETGKERIHREEAPTMARMGQPGSLGPNVLLRPVAERAVLPTVAYVAGPGEIAYFAQVSAVARALGAVAPVAVPRWSCTIVEPHVARILERHDVAPADLARENAVERRLAHESMPAPLRASIDDLRSGIGSAMRRLEHTTELEGTALVDRRVLEGARIALEHRVDRLERRIVAAMTRRNGEAARDIGTARGSLYPGGKPQERALNFLPILARHGRPLVDAMLAAAGRHARLLLEPEAPAGSPDPGLVMHDNSPTDGDAGG